MSNQDTDGRGTWCPSLARAKEPVPEEFLFGWKWFQENEGLFQPLPYGKNTPLGSPIPLARQAGIYSPSKAKVSYGTRRYALSIHFDSLERYSDWEPVVQEGSTWLFYYAAQDANEEKVPGQEYNGVLFNCMNDAVPVGVMIKEPAGFRVWGLAYVERYDKASK